jgi:hypothetical protein
MPEPTADPVTDHRVSDGFGYDEAGARRRGLHRLLDKQMYDNRPATGSTATADRRREIGAMP